MTTKEYPMRKSTLLFSGSLMLTCLGALAPAVQAQQGTTLTGNAAMVSDYRYRGISQTRFGPALQVGADLVHGSGAYAEQGQHLHRFIGNAGCGRWDQFHAAPWAPKRRKRSGCELHRLQLHAQ
ncbi:MAG: hypothetical protein EB133_12700 [Betaproteobacteria bacterium]|nr:hypothetical protein [Betaproteobacteria bacterium]